MDDHLQSFYLDLEPLYVDHEYEICILFPHTFEFNASSWYFGLQANLIAYWDNFVRVFKSKFGLQ